MASPSDAETPEATEKASTDSAEAIEEPHRPRAPAEPDTSEASSMPETAKSTPSPDASKMSAATPTGPLEPRDAAARELLSTLSPPQETTPAGTPWPPRTGRGPDRYRGDMSRHWESARTRSKKLGLAPDRPITEIPPLPSPHHTQVEFVAVQEGRSFIRISYDQDANQYLYEVIEPQLTPEERDHLELVRDTLVRTLEGRPSTSPGEWESYLTKAVEEILYDHAIPADDVTRARINYYIVRDYIGYGEIDVFMRDPLIEDISCDGPAIPIYLFHRQYESIKTSVRFPGDAALDAFVIRLAQRAGKQISIAEPLLDATLPDKSRLQCSLSHEVTTRGSSLTIRKFRTDPLTPPDLVRLGTMSSQMAAWFWIAMEHGASLILAGGTASGKTSSLNAIGTFIPPQKKIVTIEDTREINLVHENWIAGLTRAPLSGEVVGGRYAGTIDMYKLLESALRQRPEYLIVGEVRGPEAVTLFQAMATGHATYSTLHADSVSSAVYRLENPPINVPRMMLQSVGAIAVQTQARLDQRLNRRMKEIIEIVGVDPETKDLLTNTVFEWNGADDSIQYMGKSHILERFMEKRNLSPAAVDQEWDRRTHIIEYMVRKGIRRLEDVVRIVSGYYSKPDVILARIQADSEAPPGGRAPGA